MVETNVKMQMPDPQYLEMEDPRPNLTNTQKKPIEKAPNTNTSFVEPL